MSRVGRELVPEPKSSCSTSATDKPRNAASRAMPAPTIPPPMTRRSTMRSPSDRTVSSRLATLLVRLVVLVDRVVDLGDGGVERLLRGGLPEQDRLDHLLRSLARLRHHAQDGALRHAVLWRLTDLVDSGQELGIFRRPFLTWTLVVRRLDDRVVAGVGLPLSLHQRAHRVLHEFPGGLLLVRRPALHDVERRAADDVSAIGRLGIRAREEARADLELRVVDVVTKLRRAFGVHRHLGRIEGAGRTRVVDTRVVEVAAVDAGLPPIEERLRGSGVVHDLRRAIVSPVAIVGVELPRNRHPLLEEPPVDRRAEAIADGLSTCILLNKLLGRLGDLAESQRRFLWIEAGLFEGVLVVVEDRR